MIPLKLSLQNFLSYGSPAQIIDFTPYKLICLSGKNGHGKSALLDAITWALWGQARKATSTSKPDQGLMRLGQTDMVVCLDFIFNNHTYRIRRMFSTKYGKPSTHVDFGTYNPQTDSYSSITDKTIRTTQEKIEQTIGLDYESFINSSFLRQGQANEFSKKLPKERKDVLANILGLNKYEKAKKHALEKIRTLSQEKDNLAKISEHLAKEREQLPFIQEKIETVQRELSSIYTDEKLLVEEQKKIQQVREALYKKDSDFKLVQLQKEQISAQVTSAKATLASNVTAWKLTHQEHLLLADRKKLQEEKNKISEELCLRQLDYQKMLEQKDLLLGYKQQEQDLINSLRSAHEATLQDKKLHLEKLNIYKSSLAKKIGEGELSLQKIITEQATIQKAIDELGKSSDPELLISDAPTLEKQFERQKTFYLQWMEQGKRATLELKNLDHKQQLTHDADNPSCPLCEQNLSQARKRFLSKKFEEQHAFLTHRISRLKNALASLKLMIEKQKVALATTKKTDEFLQTHNDLAQKITALKELLEQEKIEGVAIDVQLAALKSEIDAAHNVALKNISLDPAYQKLQELKKTCLETIEKGERLPIYIKELTKKLSQLSHYLERWQSIDEAKVIQKERKKSIQLLCKQIRKDELFEKTIDSQLIHFKNLINEKNELTEKEKAHSSQWAKITETKNILLQEKGKLEAELKKLEQQGAQYKQFEQQSIQIQHELNDHQIIAQAFGKDGIQALLIEEALPEIEQEANDLLGRLTDNQAHIFIESLRDLKKGGAKETLDINISDNNGIRPYEMFSGGEAFRIDFSLRIAISKLLARRAGTSLQTLIIDEGFGSQDEEGLTRIMDALYKIQSDFEKIIIVSHLAAMKDQFPTHFQIEKGPHGSRASVRQQG